MEVDGNYWVGETWKGESNDKLCGDKQRSEKADTRLRESIKNELQESPTSSIL